MCRNIQCRIELIFCCLQCINENCYVKHSWWTNLTWGVCVRANVQYPSPKCWQSFHRLVLLNIINQFKVHRTGSTTYLIKTYLTQVYYTWGISCKIHFFELLPGSIQKSEKSVHFIHLSVSFHFIWCVRSWRQQSEQSFIDQTKSLLDKH